MKITFSRWPWQKRPPFWANPASYKEGDNWGWFNTGGMERFGGGWIAKLGIQISRTTIVLDLVFGSIRIKLNKEQKHETR